MDLHLDEICWIKFEKKYSLVKFLVSDYGSSCQSNRETVMG